ncbi:hypothetical protein Cylst_6443 (plasmid) [Cylindrospermum stagnale PCC 7417]|uniref:ASCH domain-containing protein n=2 Tax=Cylindrospermum stagnale TaxID=142864 RepID=K9X7Z8_9NOST|nr:hypothetical protein Cylst_6443 [Cylindrospermum stagnale PCC 7417]
MTINLAKKKQIPDPLISGIKTVTRRNWSLKTYQIITSAYDKGKKQHQAWTNCTFVPGAIQMGTITLTHRPYLEQLEDMPEEDVYHEGNLWESKIEFIQMLNFPLDEELCVVRFNFNQNILDNN